MFRIGEKIRWQFYKKIFSILFKVNHILRIKREPVIIFGDGRSGTTWLAEILENLYNSILIDEPLKPRDDYHIVKLGFSGAFQPIPERVTRDEWPEVFVYFSKLLEGNWFNPNTYRNGVRKYLKSKYVIIKFIRASLLMPWLIKNFNIKKPILIIRNPYAVVASKGKNNAFNREIEKFTLPEKKYCKEVYAEYEEYVHLVNSQKMRHLFWWCVSTRYVLDNLKRQDVVVVFYENLLLHPRNELTRILNVIEMGVDNLDKVLEKIDAPSYSNVDYSLEKKHQLLKWREGFTEEELNAMTMLVSKFGLNSLYDMDSGLPIEGAWESLHTQKNK